jgi:hypothetical protein
MALNFKVKEDKMADSIIKGLVGRKMTKKVKFMNEDIVISKLSVSQVMEIQAQAKAAGEDEKEGFGILRTVLRSAVEGADVLTDEEFEMFPMDELSTLSNAIMKFSGVGADQGK